MLETKLYRIYTEDKNRPEIIRIVSEICGGYTVIPVLGCWGNKQEESLVIEILGASLLEIQLIADRIKFVNKQEAILVTESSVVSELR